MQGFYRWMKRALTGLALVVVVGTVLYYLASTLSSIADAIQERNKIESRDEALLQTATVFYPTLTASVNLNTPTPDLGGVSFEVEEDPTEVAILQTSEPTETPTEIPPTLTETPTEIPSETPTEIPSETPTEIPSETPTETPTETATQAPTEIAQLATIIPTNTERPTALPTNTERPSHTPTDTPSNTPTPTDTLTPSATATASDTATATATATITLTASASPTASSTYTPSPIPSPTTSPYPIEGTYATPATTPIIEFPARAPLVENDPNIVNMVLMGSDARGQNIGRTDVIILVTVNKSLGTVAMWHIPRDLLVYIPSYTVDRINRAYPVGREIGYPGGGAGLMKETIFYNFGIPVDYYAIINFTDFEQIIEILGGLKISVDCQVEDWALISPELDPFVEESYERYTMRIGRQTLDPYYALWYARSRKGTGDDFDRGRRQLDILRAIFQQSRQEGLLTQFTELYPKVLEIVDTDMGLDDMLSFLPLANSLDLSRIERYNGILNTHFSNFNTPDDGRAVLLPDYENLYKLAADFVTPPTGSRLDRSAVTIEIADASAYGIGFDLVASDRLAWEGFVTSPQGQISGIRREQTTIYDYTGETKGSSLQRIMEIMRVGDSSVVFEPDPNRTVDYRIEVGTSYNTCVLGSSADEIGDGPLIIPTLDPDEEADIQTVG